MSISCHARPVIRWSTNVILVVGIALGISQSATAQQPHEQNAVQKIGMDGYCPVCVIAAKKWEMGNPQIQSTYDGVTYYFPNAEIKGKFDKSPAKYVPVLGGDCTVCLAKVGKRVPGSIRHASLYNDRLYLFPSDAEKRVFQENPGPFVNVDLAAGGECIVCLAKVNKHVPGSPEFAEIHGGLRYLFPSANEQAEFRRTPAKYAEFTKAMMRPSATQTGQQGVTPADAGIVTVAGRSACAGCEFGVTPIGNPDELGLAVNTKEGTVVVVENAHRLYPEIYKARFDGQQLEVSGQVVKTDGKISWVNPSSLRILN